MALTKNDNFGYLIHFSFQALRSTLMGGVLLLSAPSGYAADTEESNAKFQATYVWQTKAAFNADYSGANSLSSQQEKSYSYTMTAAFGFRPWAGGEIYFDPEAAQGIPLSNLTGLGGFTNGEIARTAGPRLSVYTARLFFAADLGFGRRAGSTRVRCQSIGGSGG